MQERTIDGFRLSPEQKHLWLLQQADSLSYRAECAVLIEGDLDTRVLKTALQDVISRHEILRTTFRRLPEMTIPLQVIEDTRILCVHEYDLSGLDPQEQGGRIAALGHEARRRRFELEKGSPLDTSLLRLSRDKHLLLMSLPALCGDTITLHNLICEIGRLYVANLQGGETLEKPVQYVDFSEWQTDLLETEDAKRGIEFWRNPDRGTLDAVKIPFELQCSTRSDFEPEFVARKTNPEIASKIEPLVRKYGTSISIFVLTCWQILLWRITSRADTTVGIACNGRSYHELKQALGLFAKYLPFHCDLQGELSFSEILEHATKSASDLYRWQDYFRWEHIGRTMKHETASGFFSFVFDFEEAPARYSAADLSFSVYMQYVCLDRFKLRLRCIHRSDSLIAEFYFDRDLFLASDIERLAAQFDTLFTSAVENPEAKISELGMLSDVGRQERVVEWNGTKADYSKEKFIHQLFEEQAERNADHVAVVYGEQVLSYRELNARANQVARHIQGLGVGPESLVAICVERSLEMVIGILGILKAGGAYVPLDPAYPKERLAFMLEDAKPSVLLTQGHLVSKLPRYGAQIVSLNPDRSSNSQRSEPNLESQTKAEHLVYVIYTSGSTGTPKGVMITHGNLGHYVRSIRVPMEITANDRYLHTASISFSSSVRQLMVPLSQGATVVIATSDEIRDPLALFEMVRRNRVTIMDLVPSYWRNSAHALGSLKPESVNALLDNKVRLILSASEPLLSDIPRDWVYRLKHRAKLINMLGQTETTGIVATYTISPDNNDRVKVVQVGRPIYNTQIYLLDSHLQSVPFGAPGEIHIGGAGVGRGYLNQPELTAEKFIPDPFSADPEARLYKTGDMGRYLPDGNLEFLGRMDNQVKIRGHRVELGEIEAVLRQHPGVRDAAVIAREDEIGSHRLVAYAVPDRTCAPSIAGRERYRLPNNMAIVQQNRHETDFFYQQIFIGQTNFRHGITLHDGDCVFDVGANIGLFTMFVQQVWKDITVYAFEPIPAIFETLSANVLLYGKNTKLFQCGIADDSKEVEFTYYPLSSTQSGRYANAQNDREVLRTIIANQKKGNGANWGEFIDELVEGRVKGESVICRLRSLSEIIREHNIERVDLLKIDVEKSELDVLAGIGESDWERIRQIVIEADGLGGKLERLTRLLKQHGYTVVAEEDDYIKGSGLYNIYAIRNVRNATQNGNNKLFPIPVFTDTILTVNKLRQHLQEKLPEYLIPSAFVFLDSLPLSPTGKVDRKALPAPDQERLQVEGTFVAPRDALELQLTKIWEKVLGIKRVGIRDNFFELGGHSLLAVRLFAEMEQLTGKKLPLVTLLQAPTIEQLVGVIRKKDCSARWNSLVAIQPGGSKAPFFCVHAHEGNVLFYRDLARYLGPNQPFYGLQAQGLDGKQAPLTRIEDMATHYIKEIRTVQPNGPYLLGGYCFGGVVAFDMAQKLYAQRERVALLALFDAYAPGYLELSPKSQSVWDGLLFFVRKADLHLGNLLFLGPKEKLDYIKENITRMAYWLYSGIGLPLPRARQEILNAMLHALINYHPQVYQGRLTLFRGTKQLVGYDHDPHLGWGKLAAGGVELYRIPGYDGSVILEPRVRILVGQLRSCLLTAQQMSQTPKYVEVAKENYVRSRERDFS